MYLFFLIISWGKDVYGYRVNFPPEIIRKLGKNVGENYFRH